MISNLRVGVLRLVAMCTMPLLIGCAAQSFAKDALGSGCVATTVSREQAVVLLMQTPQAIAARKAGGKVEAIAWTPKEGYRRDAFYLFMLISTISPAGVPLSNGVLGYFGVNKASADVVEPDADGAYVSGAALEAAQNVLRKKNCIGEELILKERKTSLESDE